jgi:hypothetical protein
MARIQAGAILLERVCGSSKKIKNRYAMLEDLEVSNTIQLEDYSTSSGIDGMLYIAALGGQRQLECWERVERRG